MEAIPGIANEIALLLRDPTRRTKRAEHGPEVHASTMTRFAVAREPSGGALERVLAFESW
jgi:hypothetical protein